MRSPFFCLSLCATLLAASFARGAELEATVEYNRDVRPILSDKCFHCHGFDPAHREAGLRLDVREEAVRERDGISAIVPGKPDESDAIARIFSTDRDDVMPPPKSHLHLTEAEKKILRRWVEQGAEYQPHWAFVPPAQAVPLPEVKAGDWSRGEIDRFILARMEAEGLAPAPEASRERWLRRATFDLTGLPPTQAEVAAFLADQTPGAYERVADRLLASPRFGERMAVPWLDVARYADSFGYQADVDTNAWPWRDWVVRALNENLPWDRFITWQLAGDLLPDATRDQRLATAFNRIHRKTNEGGSVPEEFRQDGISDRVHTIGTAFLGLTMECARCHDHKFDPISQRDYFALGAFFNSIDEFGLIQGGENKGLTMPQPALHLPTPEQERTLQKQRSVIEREERIQREWPAFNETAFQQWLVAPLAQPQLADLAGYFPLDAIAEGKLENAADGKQPAKPGGNKLAPGRFGQALACNGDDPLSLPDFGVRHMHDPMSFAFWLKPGENYPRAVVLANTSSFDANYCGYELLLEKGHLRWTIMREFPGNAISIRTAAALPVGEWTHVAISYDGSSRAAGLRIYLDGQLAIAQIIRDGLKRDFKIGKALEFAARGRDFGLRGGALDEIHVFKRAITPIEAAHLHDGRALSALLEKRERTPVEVALLREYFFSAVDAGARANAARLLAARTAWRETLDGVREISVMEETPAPRPAYVLLRGAYDAPGEHVERATPASLPPLPEGAPRDRLGFAQWLLAPDHPLTARVLVNRLWQEFFGRGIVVTSDNFGLQGALPSHPELLDWLARDFIANGWNHKRACRQIVLSATYRQDSRASRALRERDPDNVLLARGPARRLTAEMLRDSALALGGLLVPEIGGPPVKPYQPEGSMWKALNNFLPDYKPDEGPGLYRRSLYSFWRRTTTAPNMMAFDTPTRDTCSTRRIPTNTPLQPLVLMNDPQFVEAARALGERMLREGGASPEAQLDWLFREVAGREPKAAERPILRALWEEQRAIFSESPEGAAALLKVGAKPADKALPAIDLAAAAATATALFNLDASIVLR
jgi:hypothetical protein